MIELTVALPVWNSRHIVWLAMEGLCRQKKPGFKWELLIAEEQIEHFGQDGFSEYLDRLKEVGCERVIYYPISYRIPLPQKWQFMANNMDKNSKAFLLQSADCYSEPNRLISSMEKIEEGYDWVQNRMACFYSIHYGKMIEFDQTTYGDGCRTGINMAIKAELVRHLPVSFEESGIDNWLYDQADPKKVYWREGDQEGINTDGHNNITKNRRPRFSKITPPFKKTSKTLYDVLPEDIAKRLSDLPPREHFPETYKLYDPNH